MTDVKTLDPGIREIPRPTANGIGMLVIAIAWPIIAAALIASPFLVFGAPFEKPTGPAIVLPGAVVALLAWLVIFSGFFTVQPNQAVALTLFGRYVGTAHEQGLRWVNPFFAKHKISLRVRNFESDVLKVNELDGSPIEIAAIVVWRVTDSAQALFAVDDYVEFVQIQAESALRQMATTYPYDSDDDPSRIALRSHADEVSERLQEEIHKRLAQAGVEVIETRVSHLAYAPEIASAMLQRQQASAIIAARERIVEGAVGMVESAMDQLAAKEIVDLEGERRAHMVSNLLVVLCGDKATQPVINAGTLY